MLRFECTVRSNSQVCATNENFRDTSPILDMASFQVQMGVVGFWLLLIIRGGSAPPFSFFHKSAGGVK